MYTLHIDNMSCQHCGQRITAAIQVLDAQAEVRIDRVARQVSVRTVRALTDLQAALAAAGYPAVVQQDPASR